VVISARIPEKQQGSRIFRAKSRANREICFRRDAAAAAGRAERIGLAIPRRLLLG
jgi:hypothetical protein